MSAHHQNKSNVKGNCKYFTAPTEQDSTIF